MKKLLFVAALLVSPLVAVPAHAGKGDLLVDVFQLGMNAFNGTIPLIYTLAFLALVGAIVVLGVRNARKNAREAELRETESPSPGGINLDK